MISSDIDILVVTTKLCDLRWIEKILLGRRKESNTNKPVMQWKRLQDKNEIQLQCNLHKTSREDQKNFATTKMSLVSKD